MGFGIQIPFFANNKVAGITYDTDAQAFFDAASITDDTQKSAVNQLVLDLKSYSLWTQFHAVYPFVGGTADKHKWNLRDPQDTNSAYRINWEGTVTHDSNGITPNGTNGIGKTWLVPFNDSNIKHMTCYIRTNTVGNKYDMGVFTGGGEWGLISRYTGDNAYATFDSSFSATTTSTDARGFWGASRYSSTTSLYKNGSSIATGGGFTSYNNYIGVGGQYGRGSLYTDRNIAFASVGNGLDGTQMSNLNTAVQAFQTTLGRNV